MSNKANDFKGIWIPKKIMDLDMSLTEKILLGILISLDNENTGCYATNRYLGRILGLSPKWISKMISNIFDLGYIGLEINKDEGNNRIIRVLLDLSEKADTYPTLTGNPIPLKADTYPVKTGNPIPLKREHDNKVYRKEDNKKREHLSHFNFLKKEYPKDIKRLMETSINNWDLLIRKFNNKTYNRKPNITDLQNYILSWQDNQKQFKEIETDKKPAYLMKIS